jgi:hypothetical protein
MGNPCVHFSSLFRQSHAHLTLQFLPPSFYAINSVKARAFSNPKHRLHQELLRNRRDKHREPRIPGYANSTIRLTSITSNHRRTVPLRLVHYRLPPRKMSSRRPLHAASTTSDIT